MICLKKKVLMYNKNINMLCINLSTHKVTINNIMQELEKR